VLTSLVLTCKRLGIERYAGVKLALEGVGLVKKGRKRAGTASGASVGRWPGGADRQALQAARADYGNAL
jgi:hypothetical protein